MITWILYPKGIILNKHNIDNQAVTYHFNFIFNGNEYIMQIQKTQQKRVKYNYSNEMYFELEVIISNTSAK